MLIEGNYCESRVDATQVAQYADPYNPELDYDKFRVFLVICPGCGHALLAGQYPDGADKPSRLWPEPDRPISWLIPNIVMTSLEEAERCVKAKAHTACAVMCGRTLESICRHFETKNTSLAGGLRELLQKKIIDGRLYEWSEALRKQRNFAAHATGKRLSRDDAQDLLDFCHAICEYVFVLTKKYENFLKRHQLPGDGKASGKETDG